jgi:hypothetical protein
MDWLLTDENLAAAVVIGGFWLFAFALCLVAR